jgi:hypothetical protein
MSLLQSLGARAGKLLMNEKLLNGVIRGIDPKAMSRIISANADLLADMVGSIDPAIFTGIINKNPDLLGNLIAGLDPKALMGAVNKNPGFILGLFDNLDPDMIGRMAGMMFAKMRKAGPRRRSSDREEEQVA